MPGWVWELILVVSFCWFVAPHVVDVIVWLWEFVFDV